MPTFRSMADYIQDQMKLISRHKRIAFLSLLGATIIFVSTKIYSLTAAPSKAKECEFIYPLAEGQAKPTTITITQFDSSINWQQKGGVANDASCLNKTPVYGVVTINTSEDVKNALHFARENKLKVTSAGQQHSMGGQSFSPGGLILNMKNFKEMKLNAATKTLTVSGGAIWADVQEYLDKNGFSVKAMQSINIFTVGGTLSVNAHGVAHDPGQIGPTVKKLKVMKSDGTIVEASPTQNSELFNHAIGGYGLFGVILEADLEVVPNEVYTWSTDYIDYREFPDFYQKNIAGNPKLGLIYARISVSPNSYLTETAVHQFHKTEWREPIPDLLPASQNWINRLVINYSKTGDFGRRTRWWLEKNFEPRFHNCITRNQAMAPNEMCIVSRNQEMYDAMGYLKNRLPDTDILQEYFIPPEKMPAFIDGLRSTVTKNKANLLNITIRIVHKDTITALPYATDDRFAFVLYFNQKVNDQDSAILKKTTDDLIDLALNLGGTFYLPYQLYYSPEQLRAAYPEIDTFFATKNKYDPEGLFTNQWYQKYGPKS